MRIHRSKSAYLHIQNNIALLFCLRIYTILEAVILQANGAGGHNNTNTVFIHPLIKIFGKM